MSSLSRSIAVLTLTVSVAAASWVTFGGDPQRSGVAKEETILSPQSVKQLQLLWKLKLENTAKELNSLTPPIVQNPVYTNRGAETYVVVGGSSDNLFVIDADSGKLVWNKHFEGASQGSDTRPGYYFCPNALNDTPLIRWPKSGPTVYVISIDGKLHALNIVNGEDRFPPVQFVPPASKNWSLNSAGSIVYTSLSQNCAQTKNGVYAIDVDSPDKKPMVFETAPFGAGVWGRGGVAIGNDGSVFAATGDGTPNPEGGRYSDAVVELAPKTLKLVDYYMAENAAFITRKDLDIGNTTPVIFPYKGRQLVIVGGKEGVLTMLDSKSLGSDTHRKPLFKTPPLTNEAVDISGMGFWGAFASFEEADGTRWVYAPAWGPVSSKAPAFPITNGPTPSGSIMAFKVQDQNGQPALLPAWISRDMSVPEPPVIANGVVFALSSGEFTRQIREDGEVYSTSERMSHNTGNAVLYAFDAKTGKELFNSGKTIPSFTHLGGIAVSDGRVFVTTYDSTVYAFGIPGQ